METKVISFEGPPAIQQRVKEYARVKGMYLGAAYTELLTLALDSIQKEKQLDLPLK